MSIPITIKWGVKDKVNSQPEVGAQKAHRLQVANTLAKRKDVLGNNLPRTDRLTEGRDVFPNASRLEAPWPMSREREGEI